jgi:hypothetical protein
MCSCDKQQQATMTLPIAMDAINAIANCDGRNQHNSLWDAKALTRSAPQTQWGRPWQSASKPQGGLIDKSNKGIVRASWVSQLYSYRDNKYCRKGVNYCKVCATNANCNVLLTSAGVKGPMLNATTATIVTVSMADVNNNNNLQTTKKTKPLWHVRHMSRALQLLDKQRIELPGRAGDTVFNDERTSASNNNKKYHFVSTPKIKRMLVVWCSGPATAISSRVGSAKIISDGLPQQGCLDS